MGSGACAARGEWLDAPSMGKKGKKGRKRRPKYSAESPLELSVVVARSEPVPARWGRLAAPYEGLIRLLPEYELSGSGRDAARIIKLAMGVAAVYIVTLGKEHWFFGLLGVLIGLLTMIVPVSDVRKRRLIAWARRLAEPGERFVPRPGSLHFDGRKLTIRADERVWRSLRPGTPPAALVVGARKERQFFLGLVPPGRGSEGLWFTCPRPEELPEEVAVGELDADALPEHPVRVEPVAWLRLHEAFHEPKRSSPAGT